MEEGVPIEHGMVTRAIERAQKQVEGQNFSVRKHLLEYDDVMNKQRENIYALRREILDGKIRLGEAEEDIVGTREYLMTLAEEILDSIVDTVCAARKADFEQWDLDALKRRRNRVFAIDAGPLDFSDRTSDEIRDMLWERILASYDEKEKLVGREILQRVERDIMLQIVDQQWKDHLYSLDHLKEGIGLRGYGQRDPLVEYKKESFAMFQAMKERIDEEIVRYLWWLRPIMNEDGRGAAAARRSAGPKPPLILSGGGGDEAPPAFGGAAQPAAAAAQVGARRSRRASAATMRRSRRCGARNRRSAETIPVRAAAGRNTRSATAPRHERGLMDEIKSVDEVRELWNRVAGGDFGRAAADRAHLRRRAARAAAFRRAAESGRRQHAPDAQHQAERADRQRRHGHGHRVEARHRDGPARRHRRHPQEPVDRGAGV